MKVADKAYIAGFLDGEGCFTVTSRGSKTAPSWKPTCTITNTYLPVLKYIQSFFGGTIHAHNPKASKKHWKDRYALHLSPGPLKKLVKAVYPYLQQKARVAFLVDTFPRRRRGLLVDVEGFKRQRKALVEIRKLNQRGKIKA